MRGETNENEVFKFGYPEPHPILSKYSERRVENKKMKLVSFIFYPEPFPILCKDSER